MNRIRPIRSIVAGCPLALLCACGAEGGAAVPAPPAPVLTQLGPTFAFAARAVTVDLSGSNTHFGAGTALRFDDPAIAAARLRAGGPAFLQAEVQVGAAARLGPHSLAVTTPVGAGEERAALQGVFRVLPSLAATAAGNSGMAPQGGIADFSFRNQDREHPLAGLVRLGAGLRPLYLAAFDDRLAGYGLVDALAPPGDLGVSASTAGADVPLLYLSDPADPDAPKVTARAPTALSAGVTRNDERIAAARQSAFYALTTDADEQVLVLTLETPGALGNTVLCGALAPASGRFAEGQFFYASGDKTTQTALGLLPRRGAHYLALLPSDLSGGMDRGYSITARAAATTRISTREDPKTPDAPDRPLVSISLAGPVYSTDGAFDVPGDVDYVRIAVPRGGRLYVQAVTAGVHFGNPTAAVALAQGDCTTVLAAQRPVQQEAAVAMGTTYCAIVSSFRDAAEPYQLIVSPDL